MYPPARIGYLRSLACRRDDTEHHRRVRAHRAVSCTGKRVHGKAGPAGTPADREDPEKRTPSGTAPLTEIHNRYGRAASPGRATERRDDPNVDASYLVKVGLIGRWGCGKRAMRCSSTSRDDDKRWSGPPRFFSSQNRLVGMAKPGGVLRMSNRKFSHRK